MYGTQGLIELRKQGRIGPISINTRLHKEERGTAVFALRLRPISPSKSSTENGNTDQSRAEDQIEVVKFGANRTEAVESCAREALVKLRTLYGVSDSPLARHLQRVSGEWRKDAESSVEGPSQAGMDFVYSQDVDLYVG